MNKIFLAKPSITSLEIECVNDAVRNCWGSGYGKYINLFQDEFKGRIGSSFSIATSS